MSVRVRWEKIILRRSLEKTTIGSLFSPDSFVIDLNREFSFEGPQGQSIGR
jgi:hypothetical protein